MELMKDRGCFLPRLLIRAILAFIVCLWFSDALAATCTDKSDCLCDCYANTDGAGNDTGSGVYANASCESKGIPIRSVYFCEDFEALALHGGTAYGTGAPDYGPWGDPTGLANSCGANGYWNKAYGGSTFSCNWLNGQSCGPGGTCGFSECFAREWSAGDPWGGNGPSDGSPSACIDIAGAGEFDDELAALGTPDCPGADGIYGTGDDVTDCGPWDGGYSFGYRIAQGHTGDIIGTASLGGARSVIGLTYALAYSDNLGTASIFDDPWKHEEWGASVSTLTGGSVGCGSPPFSPAIFHTGESACISGVAAATVSDGCFGCNSLALQVGTSCGCSNSNGGTSIYRGHSFTQSGDFPYGKWGCIQLKVVLGSPSGSYKLKLNAPSTEAWSDDTSTVISANLNTQSIINDQTFSSFVWNAYANANQGFGETPTTAVIRRWTDNFVVHNGDPVSCGEIGMGLAVAPETWNICDGIVCQPNFSMINPSTCTQGSCSAASDVHAAADGTATGTIVWEMDSDCDSSNGIDYLTTLTACANSSTCDAADVCDMSAKTSTGGNGSGLYTIGIRSTRGGFTGTKTATFQVLAPAAKPGRNASGSFTITDLLQLFSDPYAPVVAER